MGFQQSVVDEEPGGIGGSSFSDKMDWFCSRETENFQIYSNIEFLTRGEHQS